MNTPIPSHPFLSDRAAAGLEKSLFAGERDAPWRAMLAAGESIARL